MMNGRAYRLSLVLVCCLIVAGIVFAARVSNARVGAVYVAVSIDNHEDARPYQRGLEKAVIVEEYLVEGGITRFVAMFDTRDLPDSVGPIRSIRPYFLDGVSNIVSAIFHIGGSPEALTQLNQNKRMMGFDGLALEGFFDYDEIAPAPHQRFISRDNLATLIARIPTPVLVNGPLLPVGPDSASKPAKTVKIDFRSPLHTITYTYDAKTKSYTKTIGGVVLGPAPKNILILETAVQLTGPYGRLKVDLERGGAALLLRDGGMQKATWRKSGAGAFFTFSDAAGKPIKVRDGQTWILVLDSLKRVTWSLK